MQIISGIKTQISPILKRQEDGNIPDTVRKALHLTAVSHLHTQRSRASQTKPESGPRGQGVENPKAGSEGCSTPSRTFLQPCAILALNKKKGEGVIKLVLPFQIAPTMRTEQALEQNDFQTYKQGLRKTSGLLLSISFEL